MANSTLAPWAQLAPGVDRLLTDDDLLRINDANWAYELVEGRLVRMTPASGGDSWTGARLSAAITTFVEARNLGRVTGADGTYVLSQPGEPVTSVAPDVAFVREGRYPSPDSPDFRRAWRVAPDLAVEVVSPNQYRPEMAEKARLYLEAGVQLLWLIWPTYRQVDVWRAGSVRPVTTLNAGDLLDGLNVLPGFTYPVTRLFS